MDDPLQDERITLIEIEKVVSDEKELVKFFNEYFSNVVSNLDIQHPSNITLHHNTVLNVQSSTKGCKQIHEIKQNRFFEWNVLQLTFC